MCVHECTHYRYFFQSHAKAIQITEDWFKLHSSICTTSEMACNPQEIVIARLPAELPCNKASLLLLVYFCTLPLNWIPIKLWYSTNNNYNVCTKIDTYSPHWLRWTQHQHWLMLLLLQHGHFLLPETLVCACPVYMYMWDNNSTYMYQ